ncbi:MAG: ABC transporter permease [Nitrospinota bacterium]
MSAYLVRRVIRALVVIVGVSFISFAILFLSGDPADLLIGEDWSREEVAAFRHRMGFDRPWYVQYLDFVRKAALHQDFGESLRHGAPSFQLIMERLPATMELAVAALFLSVVVACPVGIISAVRRNSVYDYAGMFGALLGQSIPVFWLGIMLILLFGVYLRWFPISGRGGLEHLVLPALALATYSVARNARVVRSSMLEVLRQDYVTTARAKGLSELLIVNRHALMNALIPVVTIIGLEFGHLLGGAVIIETIFAWPGVGRLMIQAVYSKDFPLVQASVTIMALIFVSLNLIVDFLYTYLDPRVRLH